LTWPISDEDFNPGLPGMAECERCHKIDDFVQYVANPYDADVNNDPTHMQWLCDNCYSDIAGDI
jgi:hypothetical protein